MDTQGGTLKKQLRSAQDWELGSMTNRTLCTIVAVIGKVRSRGQLQRICYLLRLGADWRMGVNGPYSADLVQRINNLTDTGLLVETKIDELYSYTLSPYGQRCLDDGESVIIDTEYLRKLAAAPLDVLNRAARIKWENPPLLREALELLHV